MAPLQEYHAGQPKANAIEMAWLVGQMNENVTAQYQIIPSDGQ
jgi:hypothetical protein